MTAGPIVSAALGASTPEPLVNADSAASSILPALRRRALIIVMTTLLAGGAAAALAYLVQNTYQTTAELLFDQTIGTELDALGLIPPTPNADNLAADNAAFVGSRRVAVLAAHRLGHGTTADWVQNHVTVPAPKTTDVVQVVATASSAQRVAQLANVYTLAAVQLARSDQLRRTNAIVGGLNAQLQLLKTSDPASASVRSKIAQVAALGSSGTGVPQVIQPGYPPTHRSGKPVETVALGALFGLLLGLGLALLREQTDARLRHPGAVSAAFEAPVLATVPDSRALRRRNAFASLPPDVAAPFHMVLAHLRYGAGNPVRSVLVTSSGIRQGKTTVAWNLAAAAAASGLSVILVDADLRRSTLASQYDLAPSPGLSEALSGEVAAADAVQRVPISGIGTLNGHLRRVSVLTAGSSQDEPLTLIQSSEMSELLSSLSSYYELVIVDASPIAQQSDAISLLHRVDGVLVVAPLNSSRGPEAKELRSRLAALGARVVGVIALGGGKRAGGYVAAGGPAWNLQPERGRSATQPDLPNLTPPG